MGHCLGHPPVAPSSRAPIQPRDPDPEPGDGNVCGLAVESVVVGIEVGIEIGIDVEIEVGFVVDGDV